MRTTLLTLGWQADHSTVGKRMTEKKRGVGPVGCEVCRKEFATFWHLVRHEKKTGHEGWYDVDPPPAPADKPDRDPKITILKKKDIVKAQQRRATGSAG